MTPERWHALTEGVVVWVTAAVLLYDLCARVWGGTDATVSAVVQDAAHRWPVVPFVIGLVIGHMLWPVK